MSEALWIATPWLFLLASSVCGIVFVWTLWSALVIRRQVRQTAIAADRLGLEFLNFRKVPLESGALAFPLIHPGGVTDVHLAMHGKLNGSPVVVAYYEYEMSERDGPGSDWERNASVARGAMGKEMHFSWGQLVFMFPEPLAGTPDFQVSPLKDIDYHLLRVSRPVAAAFENDRLSMKYCVTSNNPVATRLFGEPLQQFLTANPGWNVQCFRGRLMLWHEKYDVLSAEIAPSKHERLIEDLQMAVRWRQQLQAAVPKSG